jgi:hypothetical protein
MGLKPQRRIAIKDFKTICRPIATYEDLDLLFKHLVEVISRAFDVKGCSLLLYDEREKQLFRVSSYGISEEYLDLICVMQRLLASVIENNGLQNFLEQVKIEIVRLPPRMLD